MQKVILGIAILCCSIAFAKEKRIAQVICEPQQNAIHELVLDLDGSDNVSSLIRRSLSGQTVFPNQLLQGGDVVIANTKGKDAICLSCQGYNPKDGGFLVIKYLYNGLTNNYKAFYMVLEKEGSEWTLFTPPPYKQKIHSLRIKPRKLAGVLVGIEGIEINK